MLAWTKEKYNAEGNAGSLKSGHKVMQQANIINIITNKYEPQQKHRHGTVSKKITGGPKPVLRAPNLALSFYHGSKHTVVRSAWRFSYSSMDHHVKQINHR